VSTTKLSVRSVARKWKGMHCKFATVDYSINFSDAWSVNSLAT